MVESKTQIAARFIITTSDGVGESCASALASRCNALRVALGDEDRLWVGGNVGGVGVWFWDTDGITTASVVAFGTVWTIDVYVRTVEDWRSSSTAISPGVGKSSDFSSSTDPRPWGAAKLWEMRRLATAARSKIECRIVSRLDN